MRRVGKGMEQEDETPAWRTLGNEPVLDVALSPLNQHLLLRALENLQTEICRENLKISSGNNMRGTPAQIVSGLQHDDYRSLRFKYFFKFENN